jgi:hypothetical protein
MLLSATGINKAMARNMLNKRFPNIQISFSTG